MQGTTLAIGILGSILVLALRPPYALGAYFALLIWYPDYLAVSIGTIDISVGRIVVTVLLLRCLCDDGIRKKFVWSRFDKLVGLSMVVYVGMFCATRPLMQALENRCGFVMDTFFAYIVARFCIPDRTAMITVVKFIAVTLVPLALLGVVEAVTGWYAYRGLHQYCPWITVLPSFQPRFGFMRAQGPFSHPIMFGGCFVMFLPLIWVLRHQRNYWGKVAYPLCGIAVIGALSSMSSGPWSMLIIVIFCLVLEKYKRWTKVVLASLVVLCILITIVSNRPLYKVLFSYANLAGGVGWQRAGLIDAAIKHFNEWWLAGYGGRDPGWGALYFWTDFTDVTNEFILKGVEYGILGIIALCTVLIAAFRGLMRASMRTEDVELKSLYWSMGSTLVGIIALGQSVSFFGQMGHLFYSILGMIGASSCFAKYVSAESGKPFGRNLVSAYT